MGSGQSRPKAGFASAPRNQLTRTPDSAGAMSGSGSCGLNTSQHKHAEGQGQTTSVDHDISTRNQVREYSSRVSLKKPTLDTDTKNGTYVASFPVASPVTPPRRPQQMTGPAQRTQCSVVSPNGTCSPSEYSTANSKIGLVRDDTVLSFSADSTPEHPSTKDKLAVDRILGTLSKSRSQSLEGGRNREVMNFETSPLSSRGNGLKPAPPTVESGSEFRSDLISYSSRLRPRKLTFGAQNIPRSKNDPQTPSNSQSKKVDMSQSNEGGAAMATSALALLSTQDSRPAVSQGQIATVTDRTSMTVAVGVGSDSCGDLAGSTNGMSEAGQKKTRIGVSKGDDSIVMRVAHEPASSIDQTPMPQTTSIVASAPNTPFTSMAGQMIPGPSTQSSFQSTTTHDQKFENDGIAPDTSIPNVTTGTNLEDVVMTTHNTNTTAIDPTIQVQNGSMNQATSTSDTAAATDTRDVTMTNVNDPPAIIDPITYTSDGDIYGEPPIDAETSTGGKKKKKNKKRGGKGVAARKAAREAAAIGEAAGGNMTMRVNAVEYAEQGFQLAEQGSAKKARVGEGSGSQPQQPSSSSSSRQATVDEDVDMTETTTQQQPRARRRGPGPSNPIWYHRRGLSVPREESPLPPTFPEVDMTNMPAQDPATLRRNVEQLQRNIRALEAHRADLLNRQRMEDEEYERTLDRVRANDEARLVEERDRGRRRRH